MNNERYNQIIDEAYKNYRAAFVEGHVHQELDKCLSIEEFIEEIKSDADFSQKWGLKIEERELSDDERAKIYWVRRGINDPLLPALRKDIEKDNIPTKLITVTYNDIKTEIYE